MFRSVLLTVITLVAVPLPAHAQQAGSVRTVGIIGHTSSASFETGLRELG